MKHRTCVEILFKFAFFSLSEEIITYSPNETTKVVGIQSGM